MFRFRNFDTGAQIACARLTLFEAWAWQPQFPPRAIVRWQPAARWSDLTRVGLNVELAWDEDLPGVPRAFYICPKCKRRCRHIYVDYMACRVCAKLDYASRHRYRTVPGFNRLLSLRAKIGASSQPFTLIVPRPKNHLRYNRIVAEIGRAA